MMYLDFNDDEFLFSYISFDILICLGGCNRYPHLMRVQLLRLGFGALAYK
jgi:hypothetical protein